MDIKALSGHFDYSNLGSIYEAKQTLLRKVSLVEDRLKEAELKNSTYNKMLNHMHQIHHEQTKEQISMSEQRDNIEHTVEEIKHIHLIENQRCIQLENIGFDYNNKLDIHRHKMDLLLQEKKVSQANSEEDTKKIMVKMLSHLRSIKVLRKDVEELDQTKKFHGLKENEIIKAFINRKKETEVVYNLILLNHFKRYSNELDEV